MKPEPKDKELYNKIKNEINMKYKPSAYRSGLLVKKYKEEYFKKHKNNNAYIGDKPELSDLNCWFQERWRNQRGEIGYKFNGDIYRPTIRINLDTPKTFNELTKSQIERAKKEKKQKGRVKKF